MTAMLPTQPITLFPALGSCSNRVPVQVQTAPLKIHLLSVPFLVAVANWEMNKCVSYLFFSKSLFVPVVQ